MSLIKVSKYLYSDYNFFESVQRQNILTFHKTVWSERTWHIKWLSMSLLIEKEIEGDGYDKWNQISR